jgi:hypothetical protein
MIPQGTTSRQLAAIARWTLAIVLIAGSLSWWWPSARSWGATAGGLLVVFVLWVVWKTNRGDGAAPASPFQLALAGPAAIWAYHFLRHALLPGHELASGAAGTLDISELYQLGLLAMAAVLAQDLFAARRGRDLPVLLCGSAMVIGALSAALWGREAPLRQSMNFLAFAGMGLWVSVLYAKGQRPPGAMPGAVPSAVPGAMPIRVFENGHGTEAHPSPRTGNGMAPTVLRQRRDPVRLAALGGIVVLYGALAILFPLAAIVASALLLLTALLGGAMLGRLKAGLRIFLVVVLLAASGGMAALSASYLPPLAPGAGDWTAFGRGEGAFAHLAAATSGAEFLGEAVGWAGAGWMGTILLAAGAWAMWRARGGGEGVATVFRLWAAGLTLAAMLSPNGEFVPSVTLAVAFAWGLVFARPRAIPGAMPIRVFENGHGTGTGPSRRTRNGMAPCKTRNTLVLSGWVLAGLAGLLILFLALAPDEGLARWSGEAVSLGPTFLHVTSGFLAALVLAWLTGCRKVWKGLVGIALAIAAGGAGELSQLLTTTRHARLGDFLLTSAGCLAAVAPYLLAIGARMCEEPADNLPPRMTWPG